MKVEIRLNKLDGVMATLTALPPEIVSAKGGPVRRAVRLGATVIREQAKVNLRAAIKLPGKTGVTETTGFTESNIILMRKRPREGNGERFIVTVRPKVHPIGNKGRKKSRWTGKGNRKKRETKLNEIQANDIAFMMEFGTSKQAATPWLVPAFKSKAELATRTIERELVAGIDRIVKRLAAKNKGR